MQDDAAKTQKGNAAGDLALKALGTLLLIGIVFGAFTVVAVPVEMLKMVDAQRWPSRKGVITTSYAHRKTSTDRAPWWRAEICGKYQDNGDRFCIRRVRYGSFRFGSGKSAALEEVAKYPVGRECAVYYSPDNPSETILEAHPPWRGMCTLLGLGLAFLLLPVLLWLFRRRLEPGGTNTRLK